VVGQPEIGLPRFPRGANASDNLSAEAERFTADMTVRRPQGTFVSPAFQRGWAECNDSPSRDVEAQRSGPEPGKPLHIRRHRKERKKG